MSIELPTATSTHRITQRELQMIQQHVYHNPTRAGGDWRQMLEIPTADELNVDEGSPAWKAKLQKNVPVNPVDRPYKSKDQYLEIQYRLHREETVAWLRRAISAFKDEPTMKDNNESCIYTKVFVQGYLMTRLGPVCRVQFSTERAGKKIDWQHSTRLRTGSLVALSTARDGFRTLCMPAVIADHYYEDGLNQNPPTIQFFWGDIKDAILDPLEELVMIESRHGFFEATRHAMVGLQHMAMNPTPIDKYLVDGCQDDEPASYIRSGPYKDISSLIHHLPDDSQLSDDEFDSRIKIARDNFTNKFVLHGIAPEQISGYTNLDNSQLEAVHRMLTKECAIVQGPPGTGKTFTSVQVLQILLNNQARGKEAVIVSAQTNHAVDQIMALLLGLGYEIARLGGRTQNEDIKKRSMYNIRQEMRAKDRQGSKEYGQCEKERKRLCNQIQNFVTETFTERPLTPDQLYNAGLITAEQHHHFIDTEWENEEDEQQVGRIGLWLRDDLLEIRPHEYKDPLFAVLEVEPETGGREVEQADVDPDACISHDDADDDRLLGQWIPLRPKWTGAIPPDLAPTEKEILEEMEHPDPYHMDPNLRGAIYRYWQATLVEKQTIAFRKLLLQAVELSKKQKSLRWLTDVKSLRAAQVEVIGCTTTGLTKYRGLLSALSPRTILIEEAAETREANITAGLPGCLHQLLLVGDHQQLAPSTDVQDLSEEPFNLKVSMFERLVRLNLPYTMLNMQRRMISPLRQLLNPFYPRLVDHPIVSTRPQTVEGLPHNSFFFHHTWSDSQDENLSRLNVFEAEMVVGFAKYLLMNGVDPSRITILTFYRGQCKKLVTEVRRQLLRWTFPEKMIRTVDSYQGEENDIVILSLVRSNGENGPHAAGFVANKNRGVVSISRAKLGFFVFGNAVNFCSAGKTSREMWHPVAATFQRQGKMLDTSCLPLVCKNHGNKSEVKHPVEWTEHDGGCQQPCQGQLSCGHTCRRKCHPMPHSKLQCLSPCSKPLRCGHVCQNTCAEDCSCPCTAFTGASLRDTDFEDRPNVPHAQESPSKREPKLRNREPPAHVPSQAAPPPSTSWKVTNYVGSLGSPGGPNISLRRPTVEETYRPVQLDAAGNRVVGEGVVSRSALDNGSPFDNNLMDADSFPSMMTLQNALPLVPLVSSSISRSSQAEAAPKQAKKPEEAEEELLIDLF
ncbi:P-loop containing nucleoside triphosphate hydrolase protein [Microdochium trichocladiopsis]|uniref:P-loop containing nucleoside triphosphate hydrolase protein n=1 Tax=Microdochium trichocladiopsis TaxID=1682393 RepID=A0A9P8Y5M2_9PEZI|nr:P-loop containing nucleoside triphosphate hydrolase protein [Microdochium trichocladiopsis]KAH7029475.1 P-loop containing nucleoside triphosphate hydrolase protein [Microdochium trichocladiopsis]